MAELGLALLGPPAVTGTGRRSASIRARRRRCWPCSRCTRHEVSRERLAALLWPEADTRTGAGLAAPHAVGDRGGGRRGRSQVTRAAWRWTGPGPGGRDRLRDPGGRAGRRRAGPGRPAVPGRLPGRVRAARLPRVRRLAGRHGGPAPRSGWPPCSNGWSPPCASAGDLERAVAHAQRWQALDPLHEPAYQALIRLLAWTGQRSAALRQYRALVRILDTELAVRPLPETTELYDDVRAGRLAPAAGTGPAGPPPVTRAAAGPSPRRSLGVRRPGRRRAAGRPAPRPPGWPLVGRQDELQRAARGLARGGRGGPGGNVLGAAGQRQDAAAGGVPRGGAGGRERGAGRPLPRRRERAAVRARRGSAARGAVGRARSCPPGCPRTRRR